LIDTSDMSRLPRVGEHGYGSHHKPLRGGKRQVSDATVAPVMCDLSVLGGHDETALIQVLRHLFIQFLTKLRSFVSSQS
jgi:hypothetical protein